MWNDEDNNPYGAFDEHDEQVTASIHGTGAPRESAFASAFVPLTLRNPRTWTLPTRSLSAFIS